MRLAPGRVPTPIAVYELVTGPAVEPVTVAELKLHAHVDGSDEDLHLAALIVAAREMVERQTGRCLISQTWRLTLDDWPASGAEPWWDGVREGPVSMLSSAAGWVDLCKAPVLAITSVITSDEDAVATTWDAANYYLARQPNGFGRLVRKSGQTWPLIGTRAAGAIAVTFTAGYGANATDVPSALRGAILLCATHWYEHREPASACASADLMPMGLGTMIASYRVMR